VRQIARSRPYMTDAEALAIVSVFVARKHMNPLDMSTMPVCIVDCIFDFLCV